MRFTISINFALLFIDSFLISNFLPSNFDLVHEVTLCLPAVPENLFLLSNYFKVESRFSLHPIVSFSVNYLK